MTSDVAQQGVDEGVSWSVFLERWAERHIAPVMAVVVLSWMNDQEDLAGVVPQELIGVTAKQLGKRLQRHLGIRYGGWVLRRGRPTREKANTWVASRAEGEDPTSREAPTSRAEGLAAQRAVHLVHDHGPCRLCGKPSWAADGQGFVHPCCVGAVAHCETYCVGCRADLTGSREL